MLKCILILVSLMTISVVIGFFIVSALLSSSSAWSFCGQPKLECKECKCSTECNCDNHCTQTQIVQDCNIGIDTHNSWANHYTAQNYYTRLIMIVSFSLNLFLTMIIIFRKPLLNCFARRKHRHQIKKHSATQAEQMKTTHDFALVVKQILQETNPSVHLPQTATTALHARPLSIEQYPHSEMAPISTLSDTIRNI
jgi:hypothetical protein